MSSTASGLNLTHFINDTRTATTASPRLISTARKHPTDTMTMEGAVWQVEKPCGDTARLTSPVVELWRSARLGESDTS